MILDGIKINQTSSKKIITCQLFFQHAFKKLVNAGLVHWEICSLKTLLSNSNWHLNVESQRQLNICWSYLFTKYPWDFKIVKRVFKWIPFLLESHHVVPAGPKVLGLGDPASHVAETTGTYISLLISKKCLFVNNGLIQQATLQRFCAILAYLAAYILKRKF